MLSDNNAFPQRVEETNKFFMGVDLGQTNDSTAIVVVKRTTEKVWFGDPKNPRSHVRPEVFRVGFIERVPLQTTYPAIVTRVTRLLQMGVWAGNISLAIDKTGCGAPVFDMFLNCGVKPKGVLITSGDKESMDNWTHKVPKMLLISRLQALLHENRLLIQKDLPEAATLVRELSDFRVNYTDTGRMQFGAREGQHDDLVLALAIAVWDASKLSPPPAVFGNW
ncbi:hypothetical protein [Bradyrhizobium sp. Ai1a-2]|uniref:hypothetical protein n=1 Tax=Bradyrhizobium sp. Ai1a-2 TaxID=196490 RepID=UPI0004123498|nr:hypothetical protein [Bradyrhizobium sp. Ai1a-2]